MDFEQAIRQLQDSLIVSAAMESRHERFIKEHREWLEDHERVLRIHQQQHVEHDRWMVEMFSHGYGRYPVDASLTTSAAPVAIPS